MRLEGKVSVITGAGAGQGKAAALRFAAEGSSVVIADVNGAAGEMVAGAIRKTGGRAISIEADVSSDSDWTDIVRTTLHTYGKVDVLYNNAAIILDSDCSAVDIDIGVWDRVMQVNLNGPMLGCRHIIPLMTEGGGGSVINTSSIRAFVGTTRPQDAYAASKGALIALTKSLAVQFGPHGVRLNVIAPGTVETEMIAVHDAALLDQRIERYPIGRFGTPDEISHLALYLASDESKWTTGAVFVIDGGATVKYL